MKKYLCLLVFLMLGGMTVAQTQTSVNDGKGIFVQGELRATTQLKSNDVAQRGIEIEGIFGYRFDNRFSLFMPATATTGLFKTDGVKSYEQAGQLGLGFGYAPLHTDRDRLEIAVRAGNTLGGNWHFRYYDAGVRWEWTNFRAAAPYLGIGVRYQDCYKGAFGDYYFFYATVGFSILWRSTGRN